MRKHRVMGRHTVCQVQLQAAALGGLGVPVTHVIGWERLILAVQVPKQQADSRA